MSDDRSDIPAVSLAAYFAEDTVPAYDPAFRVAVMESVARRRFRIEFALRSLFGLVLAIALLLSAPAIARALATNSESVTVLAICLVLTGSIALLATRWIRAGQGLPRLLRF